jgi:ankyrin repeat protein
MAKLLIMSGANPNVKNVVGETPISVAKRSGNAELAI